MSSERLRHVAPLLLAAAAALLGGGLAPGAAYGRYVATQRLVEARSPVIDGFLDGTRAAIGGPFTHAAYFGGHYYLAETPLLTWIGALAYGAGNLIAGPAPGLGWGPALAGLLGPSLLLALLAGVAALTRQERLLPASGLLVLACAALLTPALPAAVGQSGWLLPAAALTWLIALRAAADRRSGLARGLLAGGAITAQPWLAPAALALLAWGRRGWPWRLAGLASLLAPIAAWQQLLFERPWRHAAQFVVAPPAGTMDAAAVVGLVVIAGGLAGHALRLAPARLAVVLLILAGALLMPGAPSDRLLLLIGPAVWGAGAWLTPGRVGARTAAVAALTAIAAGLVLLGVEAARSGTVHLVSYRPEQRLALAALVLLGGLAWLAGGPLRRGALAATAVAVLVGLFLAGGRGVAAAAPPSSLVPAFSGVLAGDGSTVELWRPQGGAQVTREGRLQLPSEQAAAESPLVAVRPGERYCAAAGPVVGAMIFVWEDDGHRTVQEHGRPGAGGALCFAAPPGATGLRLRLVGTERAITVEQATLWADGARLAPLPDYAVAALAFTFDWESVMGGLIHSKGGSGGYEAEAEGHAVEGADPRAIAVQRGDRMRRGAENLSDLFQPHGIRGTFYATGYNLLTGNVERRTFAGDPIYTWAGKKNRWASDYWTTNRWYGDDPYGTEATHPEWYYGSLSLKLAGQGHEIETHTFGHLYVRGATPEEIARDLAEWNKAAVELGLRPARSFAFPWRSSNSVRAPHYERLARAGITSVTRLYSLRRGAEFELDEVEEMPGLLIYPDRIIDSTPAGVVKGRQTVDEVLLRRGYASLWTHPEAVVDAEEVAAWRAVIDYAAAARARGLWVAPLGEITERVRAGRALGLVTLHDGGAVTVVVTNPGGQAVRGVVVEIPAAARFTQGGAVWSDSRGGRARVTELAAGDTVTLVAARGDEARS